MQLEYLDDSDDGGRWDTYAGARATSVTDIFAWRKVVREAYGIRSHFLLARDGSRITGALGLYELRHWAFGHYLASAVFGNAGGLYAESDAAQQALLDEARALAHRLRVSHLVIRTQGLDLPGFQVDRRFRTAIVDLDDTPDTTWKRLPATTRNQVRRGMREGFSVATGHAEVDAFFGVFHRRMRDLGSPGHGRAFYTSILRHMADRAEFFVVRDGSAVVAGALMFWVNQTAMNYHAVALREYNTRCPNYLLYWRMIEASYAKGCRWLDLGRSEAGSSQLRFKQNWRPREEDLRYNYYMVRGQALPQLDPGNPRYRLAIAAWRRLPLLVTRAVGPRLISGLA